MQPEGVIRDSTAVAATKAARASTYAPKVVNCVPVNGGLYLFKVTFDPNG